MVVGNGKEGKPDCFLAVPFSHSFVVIGESSRAVKRLLSCNLSSLHASVCSHGSSQCLNMRLKMSIVLSLSRK